MATRRQFISTGLAALSAGLAGRHAYSDLLAPGLFATATPGAPLGGPGLFRVVDPNAPTVNVGGVPFVEGFTGDAFPFFHGEFPNPGRIQIPIDTPPRPEETVDLVVVGGGVSGLGTAYLLRGHRPIVLEMHPFFGGSAQGEVWGGLRYSLGGAYIITPDKGTFLDTLYTELGLPDVVRVSIDDETVELNGAVLTGYWDGLGVPPAEHEAFTRFAAVVRGMAEDTYPEIPLPGRDDEWIIDLDQRTFREDIELQMGIPIPPTLAAGIQSYCYSSFGAGMEEISAASGWNFFAAEEFGRWVFPGGNAYLVDQCYRRLAALDEPGAPSRLRSGSAVVDVRLAGRGVQVTYVDLPTGTLHSILAKRVVMACPKHVAKHVIHDLVQIDEAKANAFASVQYRPYVVANVLLDARVRRDFYDIFTLGDGKSYPSEEQYVSAFSRVTDVLSGHYAHRPTESMASGVLTLYWPLPWGKARFTLVGGEDSWQNYAADLSGQLEQILSLTGAPMEAIRQVRMTYWGHAMPIAMPSFIAQGHAADCRRPFEGRIYFVNQDNWALPAVENCLLDAAEYVPQIMLDLGA